MKIYFAASIRAGRDLAPVYEKIVDLLRLQGEVLSEHVGSTELTSAGETDKTTDQIFERDVRWIKEADVLVAEVSVPSTGVGYEIARAESLGKPILCLYDTNSTKKLSGMIDGNPLVTVRQYGAASELEKIISDYFQSK